MLIRTWRYSVSKSVQVCAGLYRLNVTDEVVCMHLCMYVCMGSTLNIVNVNVSEDEAVCETLENPLGR